MLNNNNYQQNLENTEERYVVKKKREYAKKCIIPDSSIKNNKFKNDNYIKKENKNSINISENLPEIKG